MSVASPKSSEPSMEEILASIRRIIADDQPSPDKAENDAPPVAAKAAEKVAPVIPKPVAEPAPTAALQPSAPIAHEPVSDDVLDLDDEPAEMAAAVEDEDLVFIEREEPAPAPVIAPPPALPVIETAPAVRTAPPMAADDSLLSMQTDAAVSNAFQNLAGTILAGSQRTLDDIVKDLMRPMLKVWLDDNLPTIVERLVRAEIERVARGGR